VRVFCLQIASCHFEPLSHSFFFGWRFAYKLLSSVLSRGSHRQWQVFCLQIASCHFEPLSHSFFFGSSCYVLIADINILQIPPS
jgi:hypothetical protein